MYIKDEKLPLVLFENFLDKSKEQELFEEFKNTLEWKQDKYKFGDKEVLSPRLIRYFGNRNYNYSGQLKKATPFTETIKNLGNLIEDYLRGQSYDIEKDYFNGCLLNYYRDGNDSISYHTDKEPDMVKDGIIAVISLGVSRKFYLKNQKTNVVEKIDLNGGSLSIMNPICQKEYLHAIMKEPKITESRISLTFRRFKS